MVSLLHAIEENSLTTRSALSLGAKEASDGDLTNSELSRTAREHDETIRRPEIQHNVLDLAISQNFSENAQIVANGDDFFDSKSSAFYENVASLVNSERPKGRHFNNLGASSIPARLENLRVNRLPVVGPNRRSKSLSGDMSSISPGVFAPSLCNWLSENKELGDNGEVSCLASAQHKNGDDSQGCVRNRYDSGDSSESLSVCSEDRHSCKMVGNGNSSATTTPLEVRVSCDTWGYECDEGMSGLDVVFLRPLGAFDEDGEGDDETPIVSSRGTVRGMRNKVKVGIAVFDDAQDTCKNYRLLEKGRVVLYTTSVKVIRETYERCQAVRKIFQNHMIQFEERDVSLSKDFQRELVERTDNEHCELPQTFAGGFSLGGPEEIEHLNETGILRKMFRNVKKLRSPSTSCCKCGGYSYVPCPSCRGSKKSSRRNTFSEQFCALRCTNCDDNGLVRCDLCAY